jgi:hypothetical protein
VYVIVQIPEYTPLTIPDELPTMAIPASLEDHEPPPGSVNVVLWPTHTAAVPAIGPGSGLTVILRVIKHPVGIV